MTKMTLVRNRGLVYPRADEDFQVLKQLKVPINNLSTDFLPILAALCHQNKVKIEMIHFEILEDAMLLKVAQRWPHLVTSTSKLVTTTFPKTTKLDTAEKMMAALRSWYERHYIQTEVVVKRKAKTITVELLKTWTKEVKQ